MSCSAIYNVVCGYAVTEECGCANPCTATPTNSDEIVYKGANLPCSAIENNDTLTVAIQKLEEQICLLLAYFSTTTTTSSTTASLISTTTTTSTTDITTTTSSSTSTSTTSTTIPPACVLEGEIICD